jgi:hypothetical protein
MVDGCPVEAPTDEGEGFGGGQLEGNQGEADPGLGEGLAPDLINGDQDGTVPGELGAEAGGRGFRDVLEQSQAKSLREGCGRK